MSKLVLAYSGGLDTSYCAKYLSKDKGFEVHAVSVNTGGFSKEEITNIKKKAIELGATSYTSIDAVQTFYKKVVKYLIFGNVLKNNTYPLSVSAERIVQAIEIVNHAKKIGAKYIAHGSTGAGNDQVRFDLIFQIIAPEIEIITPIRDNQLSREVEIAYLKENGVDYPWEKAKYSINKGLWGTSVGGEETLTSHSPLPDTAYPSQLEERNPIDVKLTFTKGELTAINGEEDKPIHNITKLNTVASLFAIGRDIHVGDTIIGIKGRVGFEAAASLLIIKAHHLLEKHTLTKWQQYQKEQQGNFYGMLLHEGNYLDEVMRNIEVFLADTQKNVSGDVFITLHPYRFELNGITSKHDLMNASFGSYGEMNKGWTADDAKGFIKIIANAGKIYNHVNKNLKDD
ncbi:argininosuccinate synthase [Cellulophaga sp. 20_2_10]|uniref:argininosuccinate synthase n=1 Tax=Cellulophaga sp. 20_2_10 TaxID=2942476 RepID=UPI00201AB5BC|nr:argininosuccinate synthase domain-containing protein [Cellulophaga sp. 20_2_10]MCL5247168.1 argininosuccinate synthase [Cellulophaga sp. 20_2_10]